MSIKVNGGNAHIFVGNATLGDTLRNIFIPHRSLPQGTEIKDLNAKDRLYIDPSKVKNIAKIGFIIFVACLIITAVALAAIFFPPLAALVGGAIGVGILMGIAGGSGFLALAGLTFGSAAADKLRHGITTGCGFNVTAAPNGQVFVGEDDENAIDTDQ
jgi:hypothetical protein